MNRRKPTTGESIIITILAVVIFAVAKFSDQLQGSKLILLLVIALFAGVFSFFGFQVIKLWKQSDEEVLGIRPGSGPAYPPMPVATFQDRLRFFLSAIVFIAFVYFRQEEINPGFLIFSGLVLTAAGIYFLPALIQKLRGKEDEPLFRTKLRPEHYIGMLFGLFGVCFSIFFCYIVITKTPWFIAIPCLFPPLIIGGAFARLLVAGLRFLFRKERDPGEKHINRRQDKDPWDRPDRKL